MIRACQQRWKGGKGGKGGSVGREEVWEGRKCEKGGSGLDLIVAERFWMMFVFNLCI